MSTFAEADASCDALINLLKSKIDALETFKNDLKKFDKPSLSSEESDVLYDLVNHFPPWCYDHQQYYTFLSEKEIRGSITKHVENIESFAGFR